MIELTEQHREAIARHAESEYPNECCGALLGRFEGGDKIVNEILPISNMREAAAKHNRFLIRPEEYLLCEKTAKKLSLEIIGFYHSHPDHPAKPSQYDLEHAFPVYSYVIVSVVNGSADKTTSWLLSDDRAVFNEEEVSR
ncbi:MAG: M67 family metallopeptidase [Planctomycetaceae bacterium]|jgi:proteasome lid subunit RPN8/RPN11|nr:M67 family metallopeptidase [Planctomycetaceae bacterium]